MMENTDLKDHIRELEQKNFELLALVNERNLSNELLGAKSSKEKGYASQSKQVYYYLKKLCQYLVT